MTEKHNIEYKQSWHDDYLKWVCGFANAQGGKIFIGIDDNEKYVGVDKHKELLEDIPNKIKNLMGIIAEVNLIEEKNKYIIEISVPQYSVPISLRGRYYYRSGSVKQELTGASLNEFLLKKSGLTWDEVPESDAIIDDIDETAIKQFIKDCAKAKRISIEDNITVPQLLDKLRLRKGSKLKKAALVLFGKDPGKYFINLAVKIGRFGDSDADLRFHEVIEGNLIYMKERIEEILNAKFLIHPIEFVGFQRIEHDEYPVQAIREIILNALIHRNYAGAPTQIRVYDNSIRIWNDGGLPDGISEEDLRITHMSKPRNSLIAFACFLGGYIDSWGRGTIKIIDACKENNLPEPVLKEEQGGFVSILQKAQKQIAVINETKLNDRMLKAIEYVKEHGKITNGEYQKINECSRNTASKDLLYLVGMELLKHSEIKGAGSYYVLGSIAH